MAFCIAIEAIDKEAVDRLGHFVLAALVEAGGVLFCAVGNVTPLQLETPVKRVVLVPLVRLLFAELQSPLDQVSQIPELVPVFLDEVRRGHQMLRIGQQQLPCERAKPFAESVAALELLRRAMPEFPPSQHALLEPMANAWDDLWPVNRRRALQSAFDAISCIPRGGKLVAALHVEDAPPSADPA